MPIFFSTTVHRTENSKLDTFTLSILIFIFHKEPEDYRYERRNPRHPEVGRARPPNLSEVRSKVGSKNTNFHRRREPNKVKIFNDKDYMKAVKVSTYYLP